MMNGFFFMSSAQPKHGAVGMVGLAVVVVTQSMHGAVGIVGLIVVDWIVVVFESRVVSQSIHGAVGIVNGVVERVVGAPGC